MRKFFENKQKIRLYLVIAVIAFIWLHSAMPPESSSEESGFIKLFLFDPICSFLGVGEVSEHTVRKLAHFTEYAVLGFCVANYRRADYSGTVFRCFTVAFLDETVQIFSGRGPMIQDVWIDTAGTAAGTLLFLLALRLKRRKKKLTIIAPPNNS